MGNKELVKAHWSFWLIAVFALLWHLGGCANFLMQMKMELVARLPETHKAIINGRPAWATGGFAVAVFIGALGALLLLLRKSVAVYPFAISIVGAIVACVHTANVAINKISFSVMEIVVMIVSPIVVAAALTWYTGFSSKKAWLG